MSDFGLNNSGLLSGKVFFGDDFSCLPELMQRHSGGVYLLYDANLREYVKGITSMMGFSAVKSLVVSEEKKCLDTVMEIARWLMESQADRGALLLAVGGGILTDMAGFTAAIYKRGIDVAYIPTTLLAQVDASVGGKTGVNMDGYKNMLGVIRQPLFTYICPEFLKTLPARDFRSGVAEMLKTFIIGDREKYDAAVGLFSDYRKKDYDMSSCIGYTSDILMHLIRSAVRIKAEIVSEDQFETGERMKLNLGHTFAHAFEWYDRTVLCHSESEGMTHGEAVAAGIVCALRFSESEGLCRKGLTEKILEDFSDCGLLVSSGYPAARLYDAMIKDKKVRGGKINLVLVEDIGKVLVRKYTVGEFEKICNMSEIFMEA